MIFGSDQVKCSLIQKSKKKIADPDNTKYVFATLDNEVIDEIDIGGIEWPHHWPTGKKHFTWRFIDHTPDMRAKVQRRVFQAAFNSFQTLTKLKLDYVKRTNIKADCTVSWREDIETFSGKSVLAHAYLYYPNSTNNGKIEFNDSPESKWHFSPFGEPVEAYLVDPVNFSRGDKDLGDILTKRASQPTIQIAMHEIFHSLVGRHDLQNRHTSLMGPYVKPGWSNGKMIKKNLYWDNVSSIPRMQARFGKSGILARHLARWRAYRTNTSHYYR